MDFIEFLALMSKKMYSEDIEDEISKAFLAFDKDANGFISVGRHAIHACMLLLFMFLLCRDGVLQRNCDTS